MKSKIVFLVFACLLALSMLLASCGTKTTTTTSKTTTTTTAVAHWWDKLGTPQYGGTITISSPQDIATWDPNAPGTAPGAFGLQNAWQERLTGDNWALDPAVYPYQTNWRPSDYVVGLMGQSWEMPDASTYIVHIRPGIKWQNIPPMNGREFVAADVAWNYHRWLGGGDGFTAPQPGNPTVPHYANLDSVTATDKYTVTFKWKVPNPEFILETQQGAGQETMMEPPEAIQQWGNLNDWHHAIGTGPFIVKDYISGTSLTLDSNPNYWGHDERYPQNQLPYISHLVVLIIPTQATALSGLRSGQLDVLDGLSYQTAQPLKTSNPQLLQLSYPSGGAKTVDPRQDKPPFNDIRVRKALQLSINLPDIAANFYHGTVDPFPSSLTSKYSAGWGFPYSQWPQDLKDEYAYNPTAAKQLLADAGITTPYHTDVVADNSGDLDLLQIIKSDFSDIGIDMTINTMDPPSWTQYVRTARKADALIYSSNGGLGFTFEPSYQINRMETGFNINWEEVSDPVYDGYCDDFRNATTLDAAKAAMKNLNEYIARQHFVIATQECVNFAAYWPWFKGYSGQNFSVGGAYTGPLMLGFYASRFWIDTSMKTSMGH